MRLWSRTSVVAFAVTLVNVHRLRATALGRRAGRPGGFRRGRGRPARRCLRARTLHLEVGTVVDIEVWNEGSDDHNFTIDTLNLSTGTIEPGHTMTATFTVPNGTTEYHCTLHPDMRGEIVAG